MDLKDHGGNAFNATRSSIQPHFARAKGATRSADIAEVVTHESKTD